MYEVEYKVEISESEKKNLFTLFQKDNFIKKLLVLQNDYYVEAKESPFGGFDLKRYRSEDDTFFYTEKIWEDVGGHKARKETEKEILQNEFDIGISKNPIVLKIQKERQSFAGTYQNNEIHIDMDSVKFDHSENMRFFIEAEILCENKQDVKSLKQQMAEFLAKSLGREIVESPGMFTMAFKKL